MGENREYLTQSASDGSINISEDVVVAIASEAIGEIEGVGAMMATMTEQLTEQFMGKKPARGIRMDIQDGEITLDVYLTVKYGFAIPETAAKVLELSDQIVQENNLTTLMITHNMKDAIAHGNRLIMMDAGRVVVDISGEDKKKLTVPDLLALFSRASGSDEANDKMLLS